MHLLKYALDKYLAICQHETCTALWASFSTHSLRFWECTTSAVAWGHREEQGLIIQLWGLGLLDFFAETIIAQCSS